MKMVRYKDWDNFRRFLIGYSEQSRDRRGQLVVRGHADADWPLQTTLDRGTGFPSDEDRENYIASLLGEFRREAIRLIANPTALPDGDAFELLARHHGVPAPYLDWTESPYIASFFAFDEVEPMPRKSIAIWVFDRASFHPRGSGIELIDDLELIRLNRRALQQRGLFTRILTIRETVEQILSDALTKITIPSASKKLALAELDEMGINAASLFSDLDGAAKTARYRLRP